MDNHEDTVLSSRADARRHNREKHPKAFEYLIDEIMPAREVHLLAGASGSGKTTWLLDMLHSWARGASIFGYKSHAGKFRYLSFDRSEAESVRTATRVGLKSDAFLGTPTIKEGQTLEFTLEQICKKDPELRLLVIEGFHSFVPSKGSQSATNSYESVAHFLTDLRRNVCDKYNVTILGICHAAKSKKDDHYVLPREKVMGSAAWAAYSSTVIFVEMGNPEDPTDNARKIIFMPRNGATKTFELNFADGALVEAPRKLSHWESALMWFAKKNPGSFFTTGEAMIEAGITSRKSWDNQRQKMEEHGMIEPDSTAGKGAYRILELSPAQRHSILGEFDVVNAAAA